MSEPTTPEQARSIADSVLPRWQEANDALRSLAQQVEALTAERDELRAIIVESVAALGTAASVSQTSSIEFLQDVPGEIRKMVDTLKPGAKRYQWLRTQNECLDADTFYVGLDTKDDAICWVGSDLDAVVDAAMKAAA